MAVYGQGAGGKIGEQSGQTAMWQNLSAALGGYEQMMFGKRRDALRDDLRAQGLLSFTSDADDIFNAEGHINLPGGAKNLQSHYEQLSSGDGKRKIRRALGAGANKDDVKAFIQESVDKRNQAVINSIKMRLHEKGRTSIDEATGTVGYSDIYSVIPKLNETGGQEFKDYYDILDDSSKMELMQLGYTPGIEEARFTPEYFEKRKAQGKGNKLLAGAIGAGLVGAGIFTKRAGLIRKGVKAATGAKAVKIADAGARLPLNTQKLLRAYNSPGAIARAMDEGKITAQQAKVLSQQLRGGANFVPGAHVASKAKPVPKIPKGADPALWMRVGKGYLPIAVGMGAGGMIGQAIGGDIGEGVGALGGAISIPMFVKAYKNPTKRKAINTVLKKFAPKVLTKLGISAAGYLGPQAAEPISTALGVAGTAWAAYDVIQLAKQLPELYDLIAS